MEEKNELNDILLKSEEEEKKDKSSLILILAAVLIVFFLGVIGYKIFSETSGGDRDLPTRPKVAAKSDSYTQLDVEKKTLGENENSEDDEEVKQDDIDAKLAKIKESFKKDVEVAQKEKVEKPIIEEMKKPAIKPVQKEEEPVKNEEKKAPKIVSKPKPTPVTKEMKTKGVVVPVTPPKKSVSKKDKFYIQIGSYRNGPNKKMTDAIVSKGYSYVLRKTVNKNDGATYTRLYIGPYLNKRDAAAALINAKKDIGLSSALIKRDY